MPLGVSEPSMPFTRWQARQTAKASGALTTPALVSPDVWQAALRLADGDPHRLLVVSATDVRVMNHRR